MNYSHKFLLLLCWSSFIAWTTWTLTSQQIQLRRPGWLVRRDHHPNMSIPLPSNATLIRPTRKPCEPHNKVVYIKTHKTGSTTLCSIIDRYALTRNLTVLVPKKGHFINYMNNFNAGNIEVVGTNQSEQNWSLEVGYDVLTNHARLNKSEMDKVFHGAKYVTIIREPAAQWQSAFSFFEIWKSMPESPEPMKLFLSDPGKYFSLVMSKNQYYKQSMHNQQLFDFGMSHEDMNDEEKVRRKIEELDSDFDLVMIMEYFDESLLLLRQLLCWSMDDLIYLMHTVRSAKLRQNDDSSLTGTIREWNKGDAMLYDHFNETFWQKVREYGPSFTEDLETLQEMLLNTSDACYNKTREKKVDFRAEKFYMNRNAPKICNQLAMGDVAYTERFYDRLKEREIPWYDNQKDYFVKSPVRKKIPKLKVVTKTRKIYKRKKIPQTTKT